MKTCINQFLDGEKKQRILLAFNVGKSVDGTFVADRYRMGNHWTLLALDLHSSTAFYGDSLGWNIPINLIDIVKTLLFKIDITKYKVVCMNTSQSNSCKNPFYPIQKCSNMCGIIVMCMSAIMCTSWDSWSSWNNYIAPKHLCSPSDYSRQLRLTVISWLVNDTVDTTRIAECEIACPSKARFDTSCILEQCIDKTSPFTSSNSDYECSSDDEVIHNSNIAESNIRRRLPRKYEYKFTDIIQSSEKGYKCTFSIKLSTEEEARKWVSDYNSATQETMVFERNKKQMGKRVLRKLYLRCQHKQRQTGKHTKSTRVLKTTHKEHNTKHTNCPAQMTVTILAPYPKHNEYLVQVDQNNIHNHLITVADALRFRRLSEDVKKRYYELFKQGHSPSSAHLEHESSVMYSDDPQALADRSINPKLSDVYNLFSKWRKENLGVRTGKELFTDLERQINLYNCENETSGGKATVQRYCEGKEKEGGQPLVLAICTPLMARVHKYVQQSRELIFIDASSSFDDYNNPVFVLSTSSAIGGLPLGVVITSGESTSTIHSGMTILNRLFPKCSFYGQGSPDNIMIDDSSAEREGLQKTWPNATIHLCIFHFLQSVWRWLLDRGHNIKKEDRQCLMLLVNKLVYAKTEESLNTEYQEFKSNPTVILYKNFMTYMQSNWERKHQWATCYRNRCLTRGINTNNYAEAGIRILKDIVFKRIKAYNLIQVFDFITTTFEMYYERRLLAVAYNRVDRYIALRYKGLGASKVNDADISKSLDSNIYIVKSQKYEIEYKVDCTNWSCTCTLGRTGYPSGEPCKHQHAVATKYKLHAPNLLPYFNSNGRYLYAIIALGKDKAGDESFYAGLMDDSPHNTQQSQHKDDEPEQEQPLGSGQENLDTIIDIFQQQDELKDEVMDLCNAFYDDVGKRIESTDQQYLTGLKKFFTVYLDTVKATEPDICSTPKLSSLLHTYFSKSSSLNVAGTRHIHVQPTAISRRRKGMSKGNRMALCGRPPKRVYKDDHNVQMKRGRADHTKRKQNLKKNIMKNQANHFKHGHGH